MCPVIPRTARHTQLHLSHIGAHPNRRLDSRLRADVPARWRQRAVPARRPLAEERARGGVALLWYFLQGTDGLFKVDQFDAATL